MNADFKARRALLHVMKAVTELRYSVSMISTQTTAMGTGTPLESSFKELGDRLKSNLDSASASLADAVKVFDEPD